MDDLGSIIHHRAHTGDDDVTKLRLYTSNAGKNRRITSELLVRARAGAGRVCRAVARARQPPRRRAFSRPSDIETMNGTEQENNADRESFRSANGIRRTHCNERRKAMRELPLRASTPTRPHVVPIVCAATVVRMTRGVSVHVNDERRTTTYGCRSLHGNARQRVFHARI
jgi:hypothetical protein